MKPNYLTAALAAIAFAVACNFTVRAAAAAPYTITSLNLPPPINDAYGNELLSYRFSFPTAINDQGQISGNVYVESWFFYLLQIDTVAHPFLWQTGVMTDLAPLQDQGYYPTTFGNAGGINNLGTVAGSTTIDFRQVAAVWQNGQRILLQPQETSEWSIGFAINQLGHVAGYSVADSGGRSVIWHDGISTDLGGEFIYPVGINDADQVCGNIWVGDSYRAVIWQNGVVTTLQSFGADVGAVTTNAFGMNASGQVVGQAAHSDNTYHGFVWNGGAMIDLGVLGVPPDSSGNSAAYAINDLGQVVGESSSHGFLWSDANGNGVSDPGEMVDLNTLLPPNSGWGVSVATAINNKGQIVGYGILNGADASFVMTPPVTPAQMVQILSASVTALVQSGVALPATGGSLITKLDAAKASAAVGNVTPAVNKLFAFINQVKALVGTGKLTAAQGQALIDAAQAIIATLG